MIYNMTILQFGSLIFQNQRMASSSSLKNIQNQRIVHSSCLKKPQRMDGHERTGKELMILWPVLSLLKQFENHYYTPKHLFENFENWQVSGYIHGMITDGHLSLILRTAQHWLARPAGLKCGK
jgi:hypothetical protein